MQKLLVACSSFTVGRKRVPKQSVQEFLPRKLQLKWCKFKASSPYPWVEALAQDREGWNLQLKPWLRQWGYGAGPKLRSPNFLLDRQLLMVGKQLAVLRPARVFPDEPYHQEVQHIQPLEPSARKWLIWCFLTKSSCRLYIRPPSQVGRQKSMWMQGVPKGTPDLLATRLCCGTCFYKFCTWYHSSGTQTARSCYLCMLSERTSMPIRFLSLLCRMCSALNDRR